MTIKEKIRELSRKHQGTMTDANYLQMLYALEEMAKWKDKQYQELHEKSIDLIIDDEKKYKDAIERAKQFSEKPYLEDSAGIVEYIFPELKESEDERIRKELIEQVIYIVPDKNEVDDNGNTLLCYTTRINKYIAWLEKQGESYTKKDIDDAYLKGVTDAKNEIEKQYEVNYQIRKDIATFIFNYRGDIKDRAKWMDYLGIKVPFVEKQGEQKESKKKYRRE